VGFGALFLRNPIRPRVVLGALVGTAGLVLIFWPELSKFKLSGGPALGAALALASAISASLGNIVSAWNLRRGLPVVQMNAYGMAYGAVFMLGSVLLALAPSSTWFNQGYLGGFRHEMRIADEGERTGLA